VLVKRGHAVGGDFKHIPACASATALGCVIAYSTFNQVPPPNSLFGRTTVPGDQVLCVNPARLVGASTVEPILPSAPFAPGTLIAAGTALLHLTQPMPPTARRCRRRARIPPGDCICSTPTSSSVTY
jgi:Protein of unknown function (DUF3089)